MSGNLAVFTKNATLYTVKTSVDKKLPKIAGNQPAFHVERNDLANKELGKQRVTMNPLFSVVFR